MRSKEPVISSDAQNEALLRAPGLAARDPDHGKNKFPRAIAVVAKGLLLLTSQSKYWGPDG